MCAIAVGAAAGAFCTHAYDAKELYTQNLAGIQQLLQEQTIQAKVNLGLLEVLEAGQSDKVKSLLAGQVAAYYQGFHTFQPMSPETRRFMQLIEASSEKSPALREALKTPTK